ncbi:flavodoxin [Clostridiales bacterium CHKCI001]|nr:flavodoxin [Clostridiales bacterium CHKCI001]
MKKIISVFITCILLLSLTACGNGSSNEESSNSSSEQTPAPSVEAQESDSSSEINVSELEEATGNALVVYFSATGNTRTVAQTLSQMQNVELYEIVPEQPYTEEDLDYNNDSCRANLEQNDETARPAISGNIENIEDYDVIYVGFPIWWGTMPKILNTFFDTYDLSGKTIAPFCTSGGSGISRAVQTIEELEPSAVITEGLRTEPENASTDLTEWLNTIGLAN